MFRIESSQRRVLCAGTLLISLFNLPNFSMIETCQKASSTKKRVDKRYSMITSLRTLTACLKTAMKSCLTIISFDFLRNGNSYLNPSLDLIEKKVLGDILEKRPALKGHRLYPYHCWDDLFIFLAAAEFDVTRLSKSIRSCPSGQTDQMRRHIMFEIHLKLYETQETHHQQDSQS